ncbi:MAG: hypothetical protein K6T92_04885 [Candidatus Rokubacteria bacterium]|nr:hypothetical protein [Candidatus Rokubacteria bacterium]
MRLRYPIWTLALGTAALVAFGVGALAPVEQWLRGLAAQPGVRDAFSDPDYGRVDALTLLLSVFLLTPFGVLLLALAFVFVLIVVALLFEPVLRAFRLPEWLALPVVLLGTAGGAWAASGFWLPPSLHVLALVARAWSVYFGTPDGVPR